VIPSKFDYVKPASVAEAVQALRDGGEDAKILAGGLPDAPWMLWAGIASLWGAAVLTVITGWDYLRIGLKHMN